MSTEYMVFDKSGFSERIILLHARDFGISIHQNYEFEFQGSGFKEAMALGVGALENAKLSRVLSIPPLVEDFSLGSEEFSVGSSSSELAAPMVDDDQQQHDEEISSFYSGEDRDEVDALLNLGDKFADTADSMEVADHRSQRIEETFKTLRDLVGGDWMDTVEVLDEAIRRVKKLQMELQNLNDSRDM